MVTGIQASNVTTPVTHTEEDLRRAVEQFTTAFAQLVPIIQAQAEAFIRMWPSIHQAFLAVARVYLYMEEPPQQLRLPRRSVRRWRRR